MISRYLHSGAMVVLIAISALIAGCSSDNSPSSSRGPTYLATDYFVSALHGNDSNSGKLNAPFATIQRAIDTAAVTGGRVFVAEGAYSENITLAERVSIFGGYKDSTFVKDAAAVTSVTGSAYAVKVWGADSVTISGLTIYCANAAAIGGSSVAISVSDAVGVKIANNVIQTGMGMSGRNQNKPSTPVKSPDGQPGLAATGDGCDLLTCMDSQGGAGGTFAGMSGGRGGNACVEMPCAHGQDGGGPAGGAGGATKDFLGGKGGDGGNGGAGVSVGANGSGGASFGTLTGGFYIPASGIDGVVGDHGSGGGGGGGGGAVINKGGSGGGGGAGAQGGLGGLGGEGGGASIGILIAGNSQVTIENNTITTGKGGTGGAGAPGGDPGTPGLGAAGGVWNLNGGEGGKGGNGGAGKAGGHGGGGAGGPSIGIAEASTSTTTLSGNTITLGSSGLGGSSSGNKGADGQVKDYLKQ